MDNNDIKRIVDGILLESELLPKRESYKDLTIYEVEKYVRTSEKIVEKVKILNELLKVD